MAIACASGAMTLGVDGVLVKVEADVSQGLPGVQVVGLADTAVGESRARVRTAMGNSRLAWPATRVTIGLSPASVHKRGTGLDLAIALAVLTVTGQVPRLHDVVAYGELGLDGSVRGVPGAIIAAQCARTAGVRRVMVADENAAEVALVPDIEVCAVSSLAHATAVLNGTAIPNDIAEARAPMPGHVPDLAEVSGHHEAKLALEIAAAGGHHVMFVGPAGLGKTMLAERLPGILPPLDPDAALEATAIASLLGESDGLLRALPPFVAPHHTATAVAMIGGGATIRPGLVTRAHRGVLFLDEAPEFDRRVLDTLRQPLESGAITVSRGDQHVVMPARFQLVLAANPCPCGWSGADDSRCTCSSLVKRRYLQRISGPLADRIDVRARLIQPNMVDVLHEPTAEGSHAVAVRVVAARERAAERYRATPWRTNAEIPARELRTHWPIAREHAIDVWRAIDQGHLSLRGADRVTRLAWTVADLAGVDRPDAECVERAIALRGEW